MSGPVCVDFSNMGNKEREFGPSWQTHSSYYDNMKKSKIPVLIIENVCEYEEQLVQKCLGRGWKLVSIRVDPRSLGMAAARQGFRKGSLCHSQS